VFCGWAVIVLMMGMVVEFDALYLTLCGGYAPLEFACARGYPIVITNSGAALNASACDALEHPLHVRGAPFVRAQVNNTFFDPSDWSGAARGHVRVAPITTLFAGTPLCASMYGLAGIAYAACLVPIALTLGLLLRASFARAERKRARVLEKLLRARDAATG
jgi:hypothetical protein